MLENWLAPRLAAFQAQHPGVRFQLRERERADFSEANLDLAIWLTEGPEDFPGEQISQPQWVSVAPVDAPDAKGRTIGWPGDGGSESRDSAPEACIAVGSAGQALASVIAGLGTARVVVLAGRPAAAVAAEEGPRAGAVPYRNALGPRPGDFSAAHGYPILTTFGHTSHRQVPASACIDLAEI